MASVCKAILVGNLVRDPEVKYTASGISVCTFSLAMNHRYGEKEETCYLDVTAFGKLGELASQYLLKGRPAYVEGRIQQQSWEKEGRKYSKHVVIADTIQFLGEKSAAPRDVATQRQMPGTRPSPPLQSSHDDNDDIPF